MSHYHFTPQAAQDLDDIYDHVAQFNAASAARIIQRLQRICRLLAQFPGMGRARDDLRPKMFSFSVESYVIFYEAADDGIRILRILHGSRNFPPDLFNSP